MGIQPRLVRVRDSANYLGMDPNRFNKEVRPFLTEIPIGKQGIAFDRLELDEWVEQYKSRCGRPAGSENRRKSLWDEKQPPVYTGTKAAKFGISTKRSEVSEFEKALELAASKKRKGT